MSSGAGALNLSKMSEARRFRVKGFRGLGLRVHVALALVSCFDNLYFVLASWFRFLNWCPVVLGFYRC